MLSELSCVQINLLILKICLQLIPLPPLDNHTLITTDLITINNVVALVEHNV